MEFPIIRSRITQADSTQPSAAFYNAQNAPVGASAAIDTIAAGVYANGQNHLHTTAWQAAPQAARPVGLNPAPTNCKHPIRPTRLPQALRHHDVYRFSTLHNARGKVFLLSHSIDQGTTGKLRVALDASGTFWAVKCFRTDALVMKTGVSARGHDPRVSCSVKKVYDEARMMQAASPDLQVHDIIEAAGKMYLVHTLGRSGLLPLFTRIPDRMRTRAAHFAMYAIANKLRDMHQSGFIHGDVKVHNVLYDRGQVMLCDFESARPMAQDGCVAPRLSSTHPSPEQARGHRHGGPSDVWSLGASFGTLTYQRDRRNILVHEQTFPASLAALEAFSQWRQTLFSEDGQFYKDRLLTDQSVWGSYFRPRMQVDEYGTSFVLVHMLEPDAQKRATAGKVAAWFAPYSEKQCDDYRAATQTLDELAKDSKIARTARMLGDIHTANRQRK